MTTRKPQYPLNSDKRPQTRPGQTARVSSLTRRHFLAHSIAALSVSPFLFASNYARSTTTYESDAVVAAAPATSAAGKGSIRPFTIRIPQRELDQLHERIAATSWP